MAKEGALVGAVILGALGLGYVKSRQVQGGGSPASGGDTVTPVAISDLEPSMVGQYQQAYGLMVQMFSMKENGNSREEMKVIFLEEVRMDPIEPINAPPYHQLEGLAKKTFDINFESYINALNEHKTDSQMTDYTNAMIETIFRMYQGA